jgi:hypothetical protein
MKSGHESASACTRVIAVPALRSSLQVQCGLATLCLAMLAPVGCSSEPKQDPDRRELADDRQYELDQQFVKEPFTDQMRLGVIRQRSLGEEHFLPGSSSLSPLGRRDLTILAEALRDDGGSIAVRRGLADDALYDARIGEVRRRLEATGIDRARIVLNQSPAGGTGVATSAAFLIREKINSVPLPQGQPQELNPRDVNGSSNGGMP